jgi:hypothetical protein
MASRSVVAMVADGGQRPPSVPAVKNWRKQLQRRTMESEVSMTNPSSDRDLFLASLRMWDRDEQDLHNNRVLPGDTDTDGFVEAFVERAMGNPSRVPR